MINHYLQKNPQPLRFRQCLFLRDAFLKRLKNTNPGMNNVIVDTTLLRAIVVTIEPGQKSDAHTHPANFFYALTDGKLLVHYTDGGEETYDLKAGDAGYGDPERPHVTENVGEQTVKFLLVELKEHPYMK